MKTVQSHLLWAVILLAAALSGCVLAPIGPYQGYVQSEPPAPRYEVIGGAPVAGHVWISGYWGWNGGRHVWQPGAWAAPRPGYRWAPHRWERSGRGWQQHPGHWQRH